MRAAALRQPHGGRLQHEPHRRRDRSQRVEVGRAEDTRVEVRQQRGLLEHGARGLGEVLEGRREPERSELLPRCAVAELRLVAEREQRLAAPCPLTRAGDLEYLLDAHVGALAASRRPRERAVVAHVAAQLRQGDEDLRAVGDEPAASGLPGRPRLGHELLERAAEHVHGRRLHTGLERENVGDERLGHLVEPELSHGCLALVPGAERELRIAVEPGRAGGGGRGSRPRCRRRPCAGPGGRGGPARRTRASRA